MWNSVDYDTFVLYLYQEAIFMENIKNKPWRDIVSSFPKSPRETKDMMLNANQYISGIKKVMIIVLKDTIWLNNMYFM